MTPETLPVSLGIGRSVGVGNVNVPTGVVIQNNMYPVICRAKHKRRIRNSGRRIGHYSKQQYRVTGCDVGIQRQAGHTPVPPSRRRSE
ncbi:MAG: hypothetical protein IPH77_20580 [Ignavibacteria bacterium]|nr:hypothetical protein [Ignavibacteria bacterium]